jgi:hypothetical protein
VVSGTSYSDEMSTANATSAADDPLIGCLGSKGSATVWYKVRPSANSTLAVTAQGSSYPNAVAVWQTVRGKLSPVGCNPGGTSSTVSVSVSRNGTYYVEVASTSGAGGGLVLKAALSPR